MPFQYFITDFFACVDCLLCVDVMGVLYFSIATDRCVVLSVAFCVIVCWSGS